MPKLIEMPKLSDTMTEGTLAKWLVKEGDTISQGQSLADIETDKATMEMQSFFEGTLHRLLVKAGEKAPLNSPLAVILEEGETAPDNLDEIIAAAQATANTAAKPAAPASPSSQSQTKSRAAASEGPSTLLPRAPSPNRRIAARVPGVKSSPLARKVAEELGINLYTVTGTGPGGRIVRADVESAEPITAAPRAATPTIRPTAGPDDTRTNVSTMRKIIAERLLASKTQIPHFYLQVEVDAAPMMQFRAHLNQTSEKTTGNKYTVNDFILKAVICAAETVPAINAAWDGDAIIQYKSVGLSVAVAVEDGLVTPVIKAAEQKTLLELSQSVKDIAARAKNKKLSPDDFAGGTITVSNLGAYGIDQFSAIINPPQAAILSIGSIRNAAVVNDKGAIVSGQRMWVGLSGDHRVVDGAVAATFLAEVRKMLENPTLMLV
ncbi:MAG: 2-oxo acid dehydrogenase subunit E2 [Verrucomicrobiales bacterium]|nr:2-oxo acid dehydrogenase subunit E2 [Verrucomicrobiales bacterium]MCP5560827.1 2-oxo acid dehydrogenase subunit E2 [Verrucomicrobiaceae bacterium]